MARIQGLLFDIDGSVVPQGRSIDSKVSKVFRELHKLGLKMGPASGKNADYARGMACGIGIVWDFISSENGGYFLRLEESDPIPRYTPIINNKGMADLGRLKELVSLNPDERTFDLNEEEIHYIPESKHTIITLFPAGDNPNTTKPWEPYFNSVIKDNNLKLYVRRHPDGGIDINREGISKKTSLIETCNFLGCAPENILTVVDGSNDFEMIEETVSIAPANAANSIKKIVGKNGGYIAKKDDGFGFLEGLLHFARRDFFEEKINKRLEELLADESQSITSLDGKLTTGFNNGKLVSLQRDGTEYFHGAEKPEDLRDDSDKNEEAWKQSEIVMFPVIGPVENYEIIEPYYGKIPMDQHGISRILPFTELEKSEEGDQISFYQEGNGLLKIPNPKFKEGSNNPPYLSWPFNFRLDKKFRFEEGKLRVDLNVANLSRTEMRYNIGWHPAFRTLGNSEEGFIKVNEREYSLEDVARISKEQSAMMFKNASEASYTNKGAGKRILVEGSEGFKDLMIWTPSASSGMFCMEPVAHLPISLTAQNYFMQKPFESLREGESKNYVIKISVEESLKK